MSRKEEQSIVIDKGNKLIFQSEEEVLKYFKKPIEVLETEFLRLRSKKDFSDEESMAKEWELDELLQSPDQIWEDSHSVKGMVIYNFIKYFQDKPKGRVHYYIAVVYLAEEVPTFVFLHFPTRFGALCDRYRRGELVYRRSDEEEDHVGIEGDALHEGDPLALGLYKAMLIIRSPSDIQESLFLNYSELREETIEMADEIWRNTTSDGHTLVTFVKDLSRHEGKKAETLYYIAVTLAEGGTNSHALLFSFPTNDESLVDRYRHGENLQADEIIQENSH